jgi:hypothetical protein
MAQPDAKEPGHVNLEAGLFLRFPLSRCDRMFAEIAESAGRVPVVLERVGRPSDQQDPSFVDDET